MTWKRTVLLGAIFLAAAISFVLFFRKQERQEEFRVGHLPVT